MAELTRWEPKERNQPSYTGLLDTIGVAMQRHLWGYMDHLGLAQASSSSSVNSLLQSTQAVFSCALRSMLTLRGLPNDEVSKRAVVF